MEKAPIVFTAHGLCKKRGQGADASYTLLVPELSVRLGEKVLITGPSGSGKSTFLDMAGLVLKPDQADGFLLPDAAGALTRDAAAAWRADDVERLAVWRRSIGYILQTGGLLPFVTVRKNILTPRKLLGLAPGGQAEKLGEALGISHLLHKLPAELSVGERQRAAIARALAASPSLVLADEPTAALDPHNAATVLNLLCRMVDELGAALILVSHAPEQLTGLGFKRFEVVSGAAAGDKPGSTAILREYGAPTFQGRRP